MRKARGALLVMALILTGMVAGVPQVSAAGTYSVSINDVSATEGAPLAFRITVTPTPEVGDSVVVTATTSDGTATGGNLCPTDDYFDQTATVFLNRANPTAPFNVQTCDDAVQESSETVFVQLSNLMPFTCPTAPCTTNFGDSTGLGTILDNEAVPTASPSPSPTPSPVPLPQPTTLAAVDVVGRVGPEQNCKFSVNREGDASSVTRVNFASTGKAKLVANVAGTLVFGPGETVKSIDVDVLRRPRRQKFVTLTLSGASNATITDGSALCEIKERSDRTRRRRR